MKENAWLREPISYLQFRNFYSERALKEKLWALLIMRDVNSELWLWTRLSLLTYLLNYIEWERKQGTSK